MKERIFLITILFVLVSHVWGQSASTPDLSSPEGSWHSLIAALQTGESEVVKGVCTPEGFQSLIEIISPYDEDEPFAPTFRNWGQTWAEFDIEIFVWNANANILAGNEENRLSLVFTETDAGWKLNKWVRE